MGTIWTPTKFDDFVRIMIQIEQIISGDYIYRTFWSFWIGWKHVAAKARGAKIGAIISTLKLTVIQTFQITFYTGTDPWNQTALIWIVFVSAGLIHGENFLDMAVIGGASKRT